MGEIIRLADRRERGVSKEDRFRAILNKLISNIHLRYDSDHEDLVLTFMDEFNRYGEIANELPFDTRVDRALSITLLTLRERGSFDTVILDSLKKEVKNYTSAKDIEKVVAI